VYYGPSPDAYHKKCNPSAASNPFYTRTSISSLFTSRRSSSASILSERRSSYQYGRRRCSDASILSDRRSSETDIKREVVFSPIHECNEEVSVSQYEMTSHLEDFTNTNYELGPSKSIEVVVEQVTECCMKLESLENKEADIIQQLS